MANISFIAWMTVKEIHMNSAHLNEIAPSLLDCLEGDPPYVREYLDPID